MQKRNKAILRIINLSIILMVLIGLTFWMLSRLVFNSTPSLPKGFYWLTKASSYELGELISFYPTKTTRAQLIALKGDIPKNYQLIKYISAKENDVVCRIGNQLSINGMLTAYFEIPHIKPALDDFSCIQLKPHTFFVLSLVHPRSYDSRYFGVINESSIVGKASPFWLFKS